MGEIIYDKSKDSYQILGISPSSSDEEIKKRYRELSRLYHPDLHPNQKEYITKQEEINEAFENLSPKNRSEYDKLRRQTFGFKEKIDSALSDLSKTASNLAFRFINSSSISNLEAYDDYISFLKEIEPEFREYGETITPFIDGVSNRRGKIPRETFEQYKITVKRELEYIKRRAQAFDEFQIFYKNTLKEMEKLHSKTFSLKEYTNPANRTKYNHADYEKKKQEITEILKSLRQKRLLSLDNLKVELAKRYIKYDDFLSSRGFNEETISAQRIRELQELLPLIDQLKIILSRRGIAIEDYLFNSGLNIMTVKKEELETILESLNAPLAPNLEELDRILRGEDSEDKTMKTP